MPGTVVKRMHADDQTLDAIAASLAEELSGSRLQGALAGALCANPVAAAGGTALLGEALELDLDDVLQHDELQRASAIVEQALRDPELAFEPLLPDDAELLAIRAGALAEWCDAFVAGFALGLREEGTPGMSAETEEIIGDISAIAGGLEPEALEASGEEDERDFWQIAEFVRIATLGIFAERCAAGGARLH